MHANIVMNEAIESIIDRSIDLLADSIKVALLSNTYTENKDDQFIDIGGASDFIDAIIGTAQALGGRVIGKDTTNDFAYLDGNDSTFAAVTGGSTVGKVGIYKDTGTPTTSKILAVYDIVDVLTNGGDIVITWATPANGGVLKFASV